MNSRTLTLALSLPLVSVLSACGGGGGGTPVNPSDRGDRQPAVSQTHEGGALFNDNGELFTGWYAALRADLPRHGRSDLDVDLPDRGGGAVPRITFSDSLAIELEPVLRFGRNKDAEDRLEIAGNLVWVLANQAYLQWTRHLDYDPGQKSLQVGDIGRLDCGPDAIACYSPNDDVIILSTSWLRRVYTRLRSRNDFLVQEAAEELFLVLTHEAGHQFGYENHDGSTDGCGGVDDHCHAPVGSGSVMSYDDLPPPSGVNGSVRYGVTREDIRHIPNATWNDDEFDRYTVSMSGEPSSIDRWGVWIDHYFEVSGRTDPGRLSGGNFGGIDEIHGNGWVRGKPSENVSLPTEATWSGENSFLGVDLGQNYLGALLRADTSLRYTFGQSPNMTLRINEFEAHYDAGGGARWHDHVFSDWGDFTYRMDCERDGCSGEEAQTRWYASDAGDPSGWVGGVVEDLENEYVGSFIAEKD